MDDYTYCKYAVATKRKGCVWGFYFGCEDLQLAKKEFDKFTPDTHPHIEQVAIFTRGQWNGNRSRMRYHKNLQERTDQIPNSIGSWLINQADSGYF